jgi:hypothetical protein
MGVVDVLEYTEKLEALLKACVDKVEVGNNAR